MREMALLSPARPGEARPLRELSASLRSLLLPVETFYAGAVPIPGEHHVAYLGLAGLGLAGVGAVLAVRRRVWPTGMGFCPRADPHRTPAARRGGARLAT